MAVIGKRKKSIKRFSSTVGIGSRQQDLFGEDEINLWTSSGVSWQKSTRHRDDSAIGKGVWGWMVGRPASSAAESRLERMSDTLVSKNFASSVAAAVLPTIQSRKKFLSVTAAVSQLCWHVTCAQRRDGSCAAVACHGRVPDRQWVCASSRSSLHFRISLFVCRVASVIQGAAGRRTTFLVTTGACLSMREKRPSMYLDTRQSRASDGPVMRSRRSMSRMEDSGSMRRRRLKEIIIDGKRVRNWTMRQAQVDGHWSNRERWCCKPSRRMT